jgi:hypothetical protein
MTAPTPLPTRTPTLARRGAGPKNISFSSRFIARTPSSAATGAARVFRPPERNCHPRLSAGLFDRQMS